ncbi:hypothetical protein TNCV_3194051 [Trichonephila clavipes]|uniref:Uncharacterized protein n=1 Tax=Trichonephila clavipes TaxID=2585209 RepID=A0A8X6V0C0_TRICX|nr:hypothetical protein TNCV_3194051 [Trichonephila clavipes]
MAAETWWLWSRIRGRRLMCWSQVLLKTRPVEGWIHVKSVEAQSPPVCVVEFERGVIDGAREMERSISEIAMKFGFSRRPFHECTMNIGNPVKHQIYDITAAGKRSCKNGTNDN